MFDEKIANAGSLWRFNNRNGHNTYQAWFEPDIDSLPLIGTTHLWLGKDDILFYVGAGGDVCKFPDMDGFWAKFLVGERFVWVEESQWDFLEDVTP